MFRGLLLYTVLSYSIFSGALGSPDLLLSYFTILLHDSIILIMTHKSFNHLLTQVLEAARALGNLTRLPQVLASLNSARTDEALLLLLGHRDQEVVSAVAGALINLSANPDSRAMLVQDTRAGSSLVTALRRSSLRNLQVSICLRLRLRLKGQSVSLYCWHLV